MRFARAAVGLGGVACVALAVLLALATLSSSDSILIILAAGLAIWSFLIAIVGTGLLALGRYTRAALASALLTVVLLAWLRPFPAQFGPSGTNDALSASPQLSPGAAAASASAPRLTVLAQNLQFGGGSATEVVAVVRERQIDVLIATELTASEVERLDAAGLATLMPYRELKAAPDDSPQGTGIFSRYPLSAKESWDGALTNYAVEAEIAVPNAQPLTLIGIHPTVPQDPNWRKEFRTVSDRVAPRLKAGEHLVVAGDMNSAITHAPLRGLLATGLIDASAHTKWAWQNSTWPNERMPGIPLSGIAPPMLGLDHILVPRSVAVASADLLDLTGSDHRGVIAELRLP